MLVSWSLLILRRQWLNGYRLENKVQRSYWVILGTTLVTDWSLGNLYKFMEIFLNWSSLFGLCAIHVSF